MSHDVLLVPDHPQVRTRRVLLIWQNPHTRGFVRVGELETLTDGGFTFSYTDQARQDPAFTPLAQYPDLSSVYRSTSLPAFFANRLMSDRRRSYPEYVSQLGLTEPADPIEMLVRTGGPRATDTFHIVDDLCDLADGTVVSRFFASAIRHVEGADDRVAELRPGQELALRPDPENPKNDRALLLDVRSEAPVGYVPDWLVDDVHRLWQEAHTVKITVDRINPGAPYHLRLLCRLEARRDG